MMPGTSVPSGSINVTPRARAQATTIERAEGRAERGLDERRNLRQRELHRDLIEAPAQAQHDRERGRRGIERPGHGGRVMERSDGARR